MADLKSFAGVPPYDSELLGVFQPLLGWRGRSGLLLERRSLIEAVTSAAFAPSVSLAAGGAAAGPPQVATGNVVLDALVTHVTRQWPDRSELTADEWRATLTPDMIQSTVQQIVAGLAQVDVATGMAGPAVGGGGSVLAAYYQGTGAVVQGLVTQQPTTLNSLLLPSLNATLSFAPYRFSRFPRLADVILSPIGLLLLFRQYFFELDSFLGPSVGHVWLSPGSSVELYESTVRRELVERTIESALEVTQKSESTTETKEELSESVKQENADDMKIGASASGGFNVGVAHGEASASFDLDQARKTASEQTHNRSRSQTEKKSSEIRQSFKTTFKTVSEVTDTSSKRYMLQNTTDKLVNYELRRKMRRVGVQLQHLGTRLCWQYYADLPATGLRISRLVHLARISDADVGLHPPDAPPKPETYEEDHILQLPFQPTDYSAQQYWDEDWDTGEAPAPTPTDPKAKKHIQWQWTSKQPAKPGFELVSATFMEALRANEPDHVFQLLEEPDVGKDAPDGTFHVNLPKVNFHSAHRIDVRVRLRYQSDQASQDEAKKQYEAKMKDYENQRSRAYQEAFIRAVRDRIKAAGSVRARPFDDLRDEERHCIYRRLIDQLTYKGQAMGDKHIAAEMVRQLFDVDAILYFIAPDWWDPSSRRHAAFNVVTPDPQAVNPLTAKPVALRPTDQVDWGDNPNTVGDPYLVTEESNPAPMGASIGWVIQLDGDRMRNAFLNAAWAKIVIPMRPRREREAIAWLRDQAEQDVGLNAQYQLQPDDPQEWAGKTLEQVLDALVTKLQAEYEVGRTVDKKLEALPGERVFQKGFDPLAGGVRFDADPLSVFDQWVEVLPTDQVVAVEYEPK
jgi:hypothetical protein